MTDLPQWVARHCVACYPPRQKWCATCECHNPTPRKEESPNAP